MRFAQMLVNGGELDGVRIIGPKTIKLMTPDKMPKGASMAMGNRPWPGMGDGLGFGIKVDPVEAATLGNKGRHCWAGAANTKFWIDPKERLAVEGMAQRMSDDSPLTEDLHSLVYQAIAK